MTTATTVSKPKNFEPKDEENETAPTKTASDETPSDRTISEETIAIGKENRPLPDLPRTSKYLRQLLLKVSEEWEASVTVEGKKHRAIKVGKGEITLDGASNQYLEAKWEGGSTSLSKTKAQQVFRSLLSNEAGSLRAKGLEHIHHRKSAEQIAEIIQEEGAAIPVENNRGEKGDGKCFEITREGVRSQWDAVHRVLRRSKSAWIELTAAGKELMADLWTWELAKKAGVPLPLAKKNESLPSGYLTPRDRRDPGRYRTRGLKMATVDGEVYHAKKSLIVKGPPPEMEEKHSEDDGIAKVLQKIKVLEGSLWGQSAQPSEYVVSERGTMTQKRIRLQNGMETGAREALYVQDRFPDGIWTTGWYKDTVTKALSDEQREIDQLYPVVVDENGNILASLARYKGDDFKW
jgi:hypothetical protein